MKYSYLTDPGKVRDHNEDSVVITENANKEILLAVADGMGGHKAGDYASRYTVETLEKLIRESTLSEPAAIIESAVKQANTMLLEEANNHEEMKGMGTTLVICTIHDNVLTVANVGDSRLYLINDKIRQLSKDHSLVEEMVRLGGIKAEEARNHPDKNIITRAIGVKEDVEPDIYEYRLKKGDMILMCTDGLSNMVEDEDMFNIVKGSRDAVEAVQMLIEKANSNGGRDNIGVIVAEPLADEVSVW